MPQNKKAVGREAAWNIIATMANSIDRSMPLLSAPLLLHTYYTHHKYVLFLGGGRLLFAQQLLSIIITTTL